MPTLHHVSGHYQVILFIFSLLDISSLRRFFTNIDRSITIWGPHACLAANLTIITTYSFAVLPLISSRDVTCSQDSLFCAYMCTCGMRRMPGHPRLMGSFALAFPVYLSKNRLVLTSLTTKVLGVHNVLNRLAPSFAHFLMTSM